MMEEAYIEKIPFVDSRLGRHIVHDPRSRNFTEQIPRLATPLRKVQHRRYDPRPEPNQAIGCCTAVAECMLGNTVGNRVTGKVLGMDLAVIAYGMATSLDPFQGTYPPDDTGSSGLAAAKAMVKLGFAEDYVWYFSVDEVLRALQFHPISFGGIWTHDMFNATWGNPVIRPTGEVAGGHQWLLSGYDPKSNLISGECWWGNWGRNGRFYISVQDFGTLLEDNGDAHFTRRKMPR
jgi:hypothetical protein